MSARMPRTSAPGRARAHALAMLLAAGATACGDDLPSDSDGTSGPLLITSTSTTDGSSSSTAAIAPASSDEGGSSSSTTGGPTTVGIPDECQRSSECPDGELCVAPFDQSAGPEGKGAYACVSECVALMDEDRWCADAAACCDPLAECTDRGYCVYPEGSTGSSDGTDSSGGSTDSGSTG